MEVFGVFSVQTGLTAHKLSLPVELQNNICLLFLFFVFPWMKMKKLVLVRNDQHIFLRQNLTGLIADEI